MPSETADVRRQVKPQQPTMQTTSQAAAPPKPTEPLPCPRCGSASTKFCYYNNYNLSQPRYFCKGCRRYWTQGGTLRNVPVGGGSRKNSASASKRSRSSSVSASSSSTNSSSNSATSTSTITTTTVITAPTIPTNAATTTATTTHEPESIPVPVSASGSDVHPENLTGVKVENQYDLNLNEKFQPVMTDNGNFMSLLNSQEPGLPVGMNGYGSGFGYGFFEMGLGFGGRGGGWVYPGIGNVGDAAGADNSAWQQQLGHDVVEGNGNGNGNGLVDSDYFAWPGLAISAPGKALK